MSGFIDVSPYSPNPNHLKETICRAAAVSLATAQYMEIAIRQWNMDLMQQACLKARSRD
jgi:hypothetical protein